MQSDIFILLKKSWKSLNGNKSLLWWPISFLLLAPLATLIVLFLDLPAIHFYGFKLIPEMMKNPFVTFILTILIIFISAPFIRGVFRVSLNMVNGEPADESTGFNNILQSYQVGIALLLKIIFISISNGVFYMLLVKLTRHHVASIALSQIPTFILASLLMLTNIVVVDKKSNMFFAPIASLKLCAKHFVKSIITNFIGFLFILLSLLPAIVALSVSYGLHANKILDVLGVLLSIICLIWAIPYFFILITHYYKEVTLIRE